jgi:uncharacterized damage-inducible protein DinB
MRNIPKPAAGEYAPYVQGYIDLLPDDGLVMQQLEDDFQIVKQIVFSLPEEKLAIPWKAGEWTIKEILVHVIDTERILSYRALRFARNDFTELPGFDQDYYTTYSAANGRRIEGIMEEYATVRQATITLFNNLPDEAFRRAGTANNYPASVRALLYQIAGHELHHLSSIQENYLSDK